MGRNRQRTGIGAGEHEYVYVSQADAVELTDEMTPDYLRREMTPRRHCPQWAELCFVAPSWTTANSPTLSFQGSPSWQSSVSANSAETAGHTAAGILDSEPPINAGLPLQALCSRVVLEY
ncbi:hypothetical protein B0H13DRAFT_1872470 [Mycena leptocephala]|nr:hypothetical protein B0H13DRAFT_1872470 [Mycena leptocephala]